MRLVIAEKPSVAQSIAAVLGGKQPKGRLSGRNGCPGFLVCWTSCGSSPRRMSTTSVMANGASEDLPILPDSVKYQVPKDKQKQFKILKSLDG